MKKMVFLILHYMNINETYKCVDSIKKMISFKNYEIVIVDNGSKNKTGEKLKTKYQKENNVHVILSEDNLGFARGNNIGFKYAKETLKADFIIMINSDIYMLQSNFCNLIEEEFESSNFAVLGPRILINNNRVCDYIDKMPSLEFLKKRRKRTYRFLIFNKLNLSKMYIIMAEIIKRFFSKQKKVDTSIRKEDVLLHGCCLIFSREYIDVYDGLDERTFLYYEEFLLYLRLKKQKLKSVYNPYLMVYHNEGSSTSEKYKNQKKKIEFVLKHEIKSLNILIDELENINK